ncbi:MAG: hypothetical protein IJS89_01770 [Bacteroidaceae bacterium]|nr:hypothetical protein [Bacteroidaceae bacterium]
MTTNELYAKYLAAETTPDEERQLAEILTTDCPTDLLAARSLLLTMLPKPTPQLPKGFTLALEARMRRNRRPRLLPWAASVAAAAVLAGVFFLLQPVEDSTIPMPPMASHTATTPTKDVAKDVAQTTVRPVAQSVKSVEPTRISTKHLAVSHTAGRTTPSEHAASHVASPDSLEAEARRLVARTEAEAEARIEVSLSERIIAEVEARTDAFIKDVEAVQAQIVESTERNAILALY